VIAMPTSCSTTRDALSAYVDGELAADRAAEIADHLTSCASCSAEYQTLLETVAALRSELEPYVAPDTLRARIRSAVAATPAEVGSDAAPRVIAGSRRRRTRLLAAAAAVVVSAALGSGVTLLASGRSHGDATLESQLLASHVRSLMPDHLTDVRSSDQHNVKPWFNGRLDFSPSVPRLEEQGFPLVGGRLDYVGGRAVAVVVYSRRQHLINVFSWPGTGREESPSPSGPHGYNMVSWRSRGMQHWAVSDLNATELRSFVSLLQRADST
jgi:anti-sigma factor (TIGR02949 family)